MKTFTIYEGPSLLDGMPIVVLAQIGTRNVKTGDMVQTFILRSDIDPLEASRTGGDESICGSCPLKGTAHNGNTGQARDRDCYVVLFQAPLNKYRTYYRGRYPKSEDLASIGRDRMVRIGTYGDGLAVPQKIWDELCKEAKGHTAYTHQKNSQPDRFMTSVETLAEAEKAWDHGERTFRVISDLDQIHHNEVICPASKEAGNRTTCANCRLCAGSSTKAKSVAIVGHGTAGVRLRSRLERKHDKQIADTVG